MPRTVLRMALGVIALAAALAGRDVRAQSPTQGANPLTNPYTNPYLNPYLNPAMTTGTMNRNDALLYLYSAQQTPGGLLGGRPTAATSSPPAPRTAAARSAGVRTGVAEMPRSVMQPGAGAARYFNRGSLSGPSTGVPGAKYMRHDRYFSSNGR